MKKLMLAALAASTLLSTPALAADWQGKTYGQDAVGWYDINATVSTFCRYGTDNSGINGTNATVTPGAPGSASEADGTFNMNIQNPNDDTVQSATGTYNIAYAVCNTPYDMTLNSANGGLLSNTSTTDPAFIENVPYNVTFGFDGISGPATPIKQGSQTVAHSSEAHAGQASVNVQVPAQDKLLLQGTYSDVLYASLVPTV